MSFQGAYQLAERMRRSLAILPDLPWKEPGNCSRPIVKIRFTVSDQHRGPFDTITTGLNMPLTRLLLEEIKSVRQDAEVPGLAIERLRMARLAARAARSGIAVLIESGAGTETAALARAIHLASDRRERPLRRFPADPPHGGTLLVDDVSILGSEAQSELLRILQAESGAGLGRRAARSGARIIATATSPLTDQVRRGGFIEELYYRLQVHPIAIPPLRARRSEIPILAAVFLRAFASEEAKPIRRITRRQSGFFRAMTGRETPDSSRMPSFALSPLPKGTRSVPPSSPRSLQGSMGGLS
jgi:transcriptional regulator of acetoin/glycerol metabolism